MKWAQTESSFCRFFTAPGSYRRVHENPYTSIKGVFWSLEDDLLEQRINRTAEIEALGFQAYGQRFDFTHTIPQILASDSAKTAEELAASKPQVRIAGRIQTMRRMGKAGFVHLMQSGGRLQVYVRRHAVSERESPLYQFLHLGATVPVQGRLF